MKNYDFKTFQLPRSLSCKVSDNGDSNSLRRSARLRGCTNNNSTKSQDNSNGTNQESKLKRLKSKAPSSNSSLSIVTNCPSNNCHDETNLNEDEMMLITPHNNGSRRYRNRISHSTTASSKVESLNRSSCGRNNRGNDTVLDTALVSTTSSCPTTMSTSTLTTTVGSTFSKPNDDEEEDENVPMATSSGNKRGRTRRRASQDCSSRDEPEKEYRHTMRSRVILQGDDVVNTESDIDEEVEVEATRSSAQRKKRRGNDRKTKGSTSTTSATAKTSTMYISPLPNFSMSKRKLTVECDMKEDEFVTDNHCTNHSTGSNIRNDFDSMEEDDSSQEEESEDEVEGSEDESELPIEWIGLDEISQKLCSRNTTDITGQQCRHVLSHSYGADYGSEYYQTLLQKQEKQQYRTVTSVDIQGDIYQSNHTMTTRMRTRSISSRNEAFSSFTSPVPKTKKNTAATNNGAADTKVKTSNSNKDKKNTSKPKIESRQDVISWMVDTCEQFDFSIETLHLSVKLLDQSYTGEGRMLCYGCSCILLAAKLVEVKPASAATLAFFADSKCSMDQITKFELKISISLKFKLHFVTPYHFVHRFLHASQMVTATNAVLNQTVVTSGTAHNSQMVEDTKILSQIKGGGTGTTGSCLQALVFYFLDLSLYDAELVHLAESRVAGAAVYLARATLGFKDDRHDQIWGEGMKNYTGLSIDNLKKIILRLHSCQTEAHEHKLMSRVVKKYKHKNYFAVSRKAPLLLEDLCLPSNNEL